VTFTLPAGVVVTDEQLEQARAELAEWEGPQEPEPFVPAEQTLTDAEVAESLMRHGIRDWRDELAATAMPAVPAFDGATFQLELDGDRLGEQARRVWDAMSNGAWWTLHELAAHTGDPEASVSARIRDLRKYKFGGWTVARERIAGGRHRYRLEAADTVRRGGESGVE
jgi:hypothetical protein